MHAIKVYAEVKVQFQSFLSSILNLSGQLHDPAAVSPVERSPNTQWAEGWLSFRAYEKKIPTCNLSLVQLRVQLLYQLL
jgi:hypothetical protein